LEEEFSFLFEKLSLNDTREFVERYVKPTRVEKKKGDFL
jgi:phage gp29-like protein